MSKKDKAFKIMTIITLFFIGIPFLISASWQGYKIVNLVINVVASNITFSFMAIFYIGIEFLLSLSIVFFAIQGLIYCFKGEPNNRCFNALARSFTNISTVLLISILFTFIDLIQTGIGQEMILVIFLLALLFLSDVFIGIVTFTFYKDWVKPKIVLTILSSICLIPSVGIGLWGNFNVHDIAVYYNTISILVICILMIITACLYSYDSNKEKQDLLNAGNSNYFKNDKKDNNSILVKNWVGQDVAIPVVGGELHYESHDDKPQVQNIEDKKQENNESCFDIPQDLKEISDHQFAKNGTLLQASIPDGIKELGPGCFANCYNIKKVYIPTSVTKIGFNSFFNCSKLTYIEYKGSKQQFKAIKRGSNWLLKAGTDIINCTDGKIKITTKI